MMDSELKKSFPAWVNDNTTIFETVLGNDIDSLTGCCLLRQVKGYRVNYFYDFKGIYRGSETNNPNKIGVDMALSSGYVWDNHVTMLSKNDSMNPESANLNSLYKVSRDNYYDKFCGSTVLQMYSFYDFPLPRTLEGKLALLAIDSSHLGHYNQRFRETHNHWLELLGFEELIHVLNSTNKDDYDKIIQKYNLKGSIYIENRILRTTIDLAGLQGLFCFDLALPKEEFTLLHEFKRRALSLGARTYTTKDDLPEGLISSALIYKDQITYTFK